MPPATLSAEVPACPGWTITTVLNHLAFGLGLAYPHAVVSEPEEDERQVFGRVPWPPTRPTGPDALVWFVEHMDRCLVAFETTDPTRPCWTYGGPGVAAFWFRRAAVETSIHRLDVADALGRPDGAPDPARAADGVAETATVILPLAARLLRAEPAPIVVRCDGGDGGDGPIVLGPHDVRPAASIDGEAAAVLATLWGRHPAGVRVTGERTAVEAWVELIGRAFAGR